MIKNNTLHTLMISINGQAMFNTRALALSLCDTNSERLLGCFQGA
ncbi:hypothetical protein CPS_0303 [Colwellia psychrerythraea 34H]|uniref:Uncharacterized protein n=1 Tax=Colwellia psychrerythraea (strain 34H / ATCC BAA-681) TaxID=167879 RepID=Q48A44_COLP3|nr:hypothetical protein CPS_0303 [Colwellia psychrerythraea 34H]